jgi:hypothetical protein
MCHFFERGRCLKGDRCNHAHGTEDLSKHGGASDSLGGYGATGSSSDGRGRAGDLGAAPGRGIVDGQSVSTSDERGRQPLGPLPLSELLADYSSTSVLSGDALTAAMGDNVLHQAAYGYPACNWNDGGASYVGASMSSDAVAASAAMAAFGGLGLAPLENLQNLGLSPLESPLWNMQWASPGANYGSALGHPGSPNPYSAGLGQSPGIGESPIPSPMCVAPTPSPTPGVRHRYDDNGSLRSPYDLEKRLASLDVVVRDLASEARDFTAASGAAVGGTTSTSEQRVVHRI